MEQVFVWPIGTRSCFGCGGYLKRRRSLRVCLFFRKGYFFGSKVYWTLRYLGERSSQLDLYIPLQVLCRRATLWRILHNHLYFPRFKRNERYCACCGYILVG